jgi:hypothetical protein
LFDKPVLLTTGVLGKHQVPLWINRNLAGVVDVLPESVPPGVDLVDKPISPDQHGEPAVKLLHPNIEVLVGVLVNAAAEGDGIQPIRFVLEDGRDGATESSRDEIGVHVTRHAFGERYNWW